MDDTYCLDDLSARRFSLLDFPLCRRELLATLSDPLQAEGLVRSLRGDIEPARRALERARAACLRRGDHEGVARIAGHLVPVLALSGAFDAALARLEEAGQLGKGSPLGLAYLAAWRGLIARARGMSHEAVTELDHARARYHELGARRAVAVLTVHLGELALELGDPSADSLLREGVQLARCTGDLTLVAWALSSQCLAATSTATRLLEEARQLASAGADLGDLLRLRAEIAALDSARCGPAPPIETVRAAEATLAATGRRTPRIATLETRFARRQLERALGAYRTILSEGLRYDDALHTIELETGVRIDLSRRARLRAVLRVLLEERLENPGRALSVHELFERSWPDDRSSPESAANRTYVSIARLRKLGLGGAIRTSTDGFMLDPDVPVGALDVPPARALAS